VHGINTNEIVYENQHYKSSVRTLITVLPRFEIIYKPSESRERKKIKRF
jgi:hypothetical protein